DGVIDLKKQKNKNITQVEATLEPQKQMSIFDASQDFSKGDLLLQEISDSDFAPLPAKPAAPKINKIRSKQLGENKNKMTEEKNNIEQIQTINQNIDIKQAEPKPSAPKPSMPKPSAPKVAAPKPPLPKAASKPVPPAVAKPATLTSVKKPALPVAPIAATTLKDSSKKCELDRTTTIDHTIQVPAGQIYKRSNWPLEIPLIPTFTFENMDMSSNRFVHATAISVMENLGNIYNPFVIFGDGGSGKTHFLNAMGYELSKKIPQDKIYITNGVRFSRGIQRYVEEGRIAKLEEFFNNSQVLIIDDIHLTAVNEHNREVISKVLNTFLKEKKQIIISSKYPPESLARFEELVNFRLDHGWVGEIKSPRPQHFTRIYNKMVRDADLGISDTQAQVFFGRDGFNLGTIARSIRRAKVLRRRMEDSGSAILSYEDILNEMLAVNGENEDSEIIKKNFGDITALRRGENTDWGTFGFFFPQDQADKFKWIVYATMQRAKELGIKGGFNFALKSAYSTENIISSAFKIANICDNKNLKGAIILGPSVTSCAPAIRENFYDILSHMLEVMMIRCGIVDAEFIKTPSAYVKVLGDVLK
ncbi:MAG: ATP-binding protein, partial [Elusimicrobiota bacterium]|nr:ATP-binding protein [Elusimicrobiota bacterium]